MIKKRVDSAQELLKKDQVRLVGILKKQIIFESKCKSQVNVKFSSLDNDKAIRILSRTIAWLYRDWQSAIGSEMIKESANGIRHYEVIDFGEFESLYNTKKNVWIKRLEKLFINLNVDSKEFYDERIMQLQTIFTKTVNMANAFYNLEKQHNVSTKKSLEQLTQFNNDVLLKQKMPNNCFDLTSPLA